MNAIGFKVCEGEGFAVEILIDGISVSRIFNREEMPLAGAYFEGDFPTFPPNSVVPAEGRRLVAVCSCGEYGCANINCLAIANSKTITWRDFRGYSKEITNSPLFEFDKDEYLSIVNEIEKRTQEYFHRTKELRAN